MLGHSLLSLLPLGSKMGLTYVVTGTRGTLRYTQERMAELALYIHDEPAGRQGFKTLLTGPAHPDYASFCVSASCFFSSPSIRRLPSR